ncbi:MAG: hypothetical protein Q9221_002161 [Calogaya cf. arnoldii]
MSIYYESRQSEIYGGTISLIVLATLSVAIFFAAKFTYFASGASIKTSLILLYYRIFGVVRWFRLLLAAVGAIVLLYFVVCLFVAVFECKPVAFYWDKSIENGTCIDQNQFYRWHGVANLLIDFLIWSLTLPVVWRLHMTLRQKLSLSFVFLLGLLACIASIVRVVAFNQVNFEDVTYTMVDVEIWTIMEQSIAIICACLPTTRPLIARFLKGVKTSSYDDALGQKMAASSIPLSHYPARHGVHGSTDTNTDGFVRLTEAKAQS